MNLSDKEKQNALNEVRILASIRNPTIIGYKEAFLDETSNSLCIVMEYADDGDLFQKIVDHQKKGILFQENEIWSMLIQVTKALKALHDLKIFHRDLKSANVFLNKEGLVKLGDMNVSKVAKRGLLYTQTGTPYYASPEVWKDQPYDAKSDIWSLGCVLYEVTTLKPPFRAEDMEGLYRKVIRGYYPRIPPHFSQDLSNVIRALLQVAPHLRPSADKILQLPAVLRRMNDTHFTEVIDETVNNSLLNTIKIPRNLHYLTDRLPKPNYIPLKTKKVDRQRFLQTLAGYRSEGNTNQDDQSFVDVNTLAENKRSLLPQIPVRKNNHQQVPSVKQQNINNTNQEELQDDQSYQRHNSRKQVSQSQVPANKRRVYEENMSLPNRDDQSIISKQTDNSKQDYRRILGDRNAANQQQYVPGHKPKTKVNPVANVNSNNNYTPNKRPNQINKKQQLESLQGGIQGERIVKKQYQQPVEQNEEESKLPQINVSRLPRIHDSPDKLPTINSQNSNQQQQRLQRIQQAYKVNKDDLSGQNGQKQQKRIPKATNNQSVDLRNNNNINSLNSNSIQADSQQGRGRGGGGGGAGGAGLEYDSIKNSASQAKIDNKQYHSNNVVENN